MERTLIGTVCTISWGCSLKSTPKKSHSVRSLSLVKNRHVPPSSWSTLNRISDRKHWAIFPILVHWTKWHPVQPGADWDLLFIMPAGMHFRAAKHYHKLQKHSVLTTYSWHYAATGSIYQIDRGDNSVNLALADFPINIVIRLQEENRDRRKDMALSLLLLFKRMSLNIQTCAWAKF